MGDGTNRAAKSQVEDLVAALGKNDKRGAFPWRRPQVSFLFRFFG